MEPVIVVAMYGKVALKGLPNHKGTETDYFLSIDDQAVPKTRTHDPNPPSNERLAAYFATSENRIEKALRDFFEDTKQVKEIMKELRKNMALL